MALVSSTAQHRFALNDSKVSVSHSVLCGVMLACPTSSWFSSAKWSLPSRDKQSGTRKPGHGVVLPWLSCHPDSPYGHHFGSWLPHSSSSLLLMLPGTSRKGPKHLGLRAVRETQKLLLLDGEWMKDHFSVFPSLYITLPFQWNERENEEAKTQVVGRHFIRM